MGLGLLRCVLCSLKPLRTARLRKPGRKIASLARFSAPFKSPSVAKKKGSGWTPSFLVRLMGLEPIRSPIRPSNVRVCLFRHNRSFYVANDIISPRRKNVKLFLKKAKYMICRPKKRPQVRNKNAPYGSPAALRSPRACDKINISIELRYRDHFDQEALP